MKIGAFRYNKKPKRVEAFSDDFNPNEIAEVKDNHQRGVKFATATNHFEENWESNSESFEVLKNTPRDFSPTSAMIADLESFRQEENYESAENAEDFARRRGRIMNRMGRRHGRLGARFAAHNLGETHMASEFRGIRGTLTMAVTRVSYNIPFTLVVEMFNPLDLLYNAGLLINKFALPGTTFISANINPLDGSLVFTYALTANLATRDTVVIQCQEVNYAEFLGGMVCGDVFQIGGGPAEKPGGQCVLSDAAQANIQWPQQWQFVHQNSLGTNSAKPLNGGMFIDSRQFQLQYQNILIGFPLDKERGVMFYAAFIPTYPGTGQELIATFQWNFSVVHFNNHRAPHVRHHHGRLLRHHLEQFETADSLEGDWESFKN